MGAAGLQNPNRQLGGNVSFAQSLSGSQPATPLDLSYVYSSSLPSLIKPSPTYSATFAFAMSSQPGKKPRLVAKQGNLSGLSSTVDSPHRTAYANIVKGYCSCLPATAFHPHHHHHYHVYTTRGPFLP